MENPILTLQLEIKNLECDLHDAKLDLKNNKPLINMINGRINEHNLAIKILSEAPDEILDVMDNKAKKKICPRCGDTVLTDVVGVKYCGSWRCNGKQI